MNHPDAYIKRSDLLSSQSSDRRYLSDFGLAAPYVALSSQRLHVAAHSWLTFVPQPLALFYHDFQPQTSLPVTTQRFKRSSPSQLYKHYQTIITKTISSPL